MFNHTTSYNVPGQTTLPLYGCYFDPLKDILKNNVTPSDVTKWHLVNANVTINSLIFIITFPTMCISICGLYRLVKSDHVAPVFIINLFISDLIQVSINLITYYVQKYVSSTAGLAEIWLIYNYCIMVNVAFMVCISAERYIMIVYPLLYKVTKNIKTSILVAVAVWIIVGVIEIITYFCGYFYGCWIVMLLVPYVPVLFFFVGTWMALSRSTLPPQEQRRILGLLALVLGIYTVLFLPYLIVLIEALRRVLGYSLSWPYLLFSAKSLIALNPIFDLLLYMFVRRDVKKIFHKVVFHSKGKVNIDTAFVQML